MKFDYLIVGAGLSGCVLADYLSENGKSVIIVEQRNEIGGNLRCEDMDGITVHKYGAHIFRTNDLFVWNYVNKFAEFNHFVNSPIANYNGEIYNLPFNMNTFHQLFGVNTPEEAIEAIRVDRVNYDHPKNLEEHVVNLVGKTVYKKLIKEYTEKQWGRECKDLPADIMRRLPVRFTYDNNYFNAKYQGIPINGYNDMIGRMIEGIPVIKGTNFNKNRQNLSNLANRVIYTGAIDELFDYCYGKLEYRSLKFEHEVIQKNNVQGVAVVNYTSKAVPYTRTIEHKHFLFGDDLAYSVVSKEYPIEWTGNEEPYYPINDQKNNELYEKYAFDARGLEYVLCGRLAEYKYYDMQDTIISSIKTAKRLLEAEHGEKD